MAAGTVAGGTPGAAASTAPATRAGPRRWAIELAIVAAFYVTYDTARNAVAGTTAAATRNAAQVIDVERRLGLYWERSVQRLVIDHTWLVKAIDGWYGWVHFIVPISTFVLLLRRDPERERIWRTTFVLLCGLGLLGFALYPLLPPRLLPPSHGFVDTMVTIGGPFIRPQSASDVGNAYAAMPSLHAGWSLWCALALWPVLRSPWARVAIAAYPLVTAFVVMATANHYLLDVLAGWAFLGLARGGAWSLDRVRDRFSGRFTRRQPHADRAHPASPPTVGAG
jgi:hypothetical protein